MSKFNELITKINSYDEKDSRMITLLRETILIADREENLTSMISLRYDLIHCYFDNVKSDMTLKLVGDLTRIMDKYYYELDEDDIENIMMGYSIVCREIYKFHQVPMNKILELHEDFKTKLIKNSISLASYYEVKLDFLAYIGEKEEFKKILKKYLDLEEEEPLTGCIQCKESFKLDYFIYADDMESCKSILEKYYNKEFTCKEANENIATILFSTNCERGNLEEASKVVEQFEEILNQDRFYLNEFKNLILYYGVKDENHATELIEKFLGNILESTDPFGNYENFNMIWLFFEKLKYEGKKEVNIKLPDVLEIYKKDNRYDIDELVDFFKNKMLNILLKFKERDGNIRHNDLHKTAAKLFLDKKFEDIV